MSRRNLTRLVDTRLLTEEADLAHTFGELLQQCRQTMNAHNTKFLKLLESLTVISYLMIISALMMTLSG